MKRGNIFSVNMEALKDRKVSDYADGLADD